MPEFGLGQLCHFENQPQASVFPKLRRQRTYRMEFLIVH